ncbi:MAG: fluoride efflux transporter CrcB [Comamonadaceae bacterium]|jgi:CrcB protein|nr:fluoride efflux transporter CrcB [Comamonadaceae bacterium]
MQTVLAICVGASLGALARWQLGLWLSHGGLIAWGTLAANLIGGFLVGLAIGAINARPELDPVWRLFLITGFLGGLTTFSSFSAEVMSELAEGRLGLALFTALAHLIGSLVLTWLGLKLVAWWAS